MGSFWYGKNVAKIANFWRLDASWEKAFSVFLKCQSCLHKWTFLNYFMWNRLARRNENVQNHQNSPSHPLWHENFHFFLQKNHNLGRLAVTVYWYLIKFQSYNHLKQFYTGQVATSSLGQKGIEWSVKLRISTCKSKSVETLKIQYTT